MTTTPFASSARIAAAACCAWLAVAAGTANAAGASADRRAECRSYAQRAIDRNDRPRFIANCIFSNAPMAEIEARQRGSTARQQAQRDGDDAQYPIARVQADVRSGCNAYNGSGTLVLDCGCMVREADRHLAEGRLPRRAIAQKEFDPSPCVDRSATADKWVAREFSGGQANMLRNAGIDVEGLKACTHRAIAQDMPRTSLSSFDGMRAELKQRCVARRG